MRVQEQLGLGALSGLELRPALQTLALALPAGMSELSDTDRKELEGQLKAREDLLLPMYHQVAVQFADLHDKAGRMLEKGVIYVRACGRSSLCEWPSLRSPGVQHTQNICTQACGMRQIPALRITWGKKKRTKTTPVVKNPPSNAGDVGSIPGQGTKITMTQGS